MLKALSVHQPWASAIAHSLKRIETRSWAPEYRGRLAIHATLQPPLWGALAEEQMVQLANREGGPLPTGAVLCVCELRDVVAVDRIEGLGADERAWGDFEPRRFAWLLDDVIRLPKPINVKGFPRLWTPPAILIKAIDDQIEETA